MATRGLVVLVVAARTGASWPRFRATELSQLNVHAIHIPKAGGTTADAAAKMIRCEAMAYAKPYASPECVAICDAFRRTGAIPSKDEVAGVGDRELRRACNPMPSHDAALELCHAAHGLDQAYGAPLESHARNHPCEVRAPPRRWPDALGRDFLARYPRRRDRPWFGCALCFTFLRDPWRRAVSGWFYRGHHPGSDEFGVGWPPVGGFLARRRLREEAHVWRNASATSPDYASATFLDYARASAYANVATRMLGMNEHAYAGAATPDDAALARGVGVLRRVPFGLLEAPRESYALLARAFSVNASTCHKLRDDFQTLADVGARRSNAESLRRAAAVASNATLRRAFERHNGLDRALYGAARGIFCDEWRAALADPASCIPALARSGDVDAAPDICAAAGSKGARHY